MVEKKVVDLSPVISKVISIISIILIFYNVLVDLMYGDPINTHPIMISVLCLFFVNISGKTTDKK